MPNNNLLATQDPNNPLAQVQLQPNVGLGKKPINPFVGISNLINNALPTTNQKINQELTTDLNQQLSTFQPITKPTTPTTPTQPVQPNSQGLQGSNFQLTPPPQTELNVPRVQNLAEQFTPVDPQVSAASAQTQLAGERATQDAIQRASQGFQSPLSAPLTEQSLALLQDPLQGRDLDAQTASQLAGYDRNQAMALEALRAGTADLSGSGQRFGELVDASLEGAFNRSQLEAALEIEEANLRRNALLDALAQGRATESQGSELFTRGIQDIASARAMGEGQAARTQAGQQFGIQTGAGLVGAEAELEEAAKDRAIQTARVNNEGFGLAFDGITNMIDRGVIGGEAGAQLMSNMMGDSVPIVPIDAIERQTQEIQGMMLGLSEVYAGMRNDQGIIRDANGQIAGFATPEDEEAFINFTGQALGLTDPNATGSAPTQTPGIITGGSKGKDFAKGAAVSGGLTLGGALAAGAPAFAAGPIVGGMALLGGVAYVGVKNLFKRLFK